MTGEDRNRAARLIDDALALLDGLGEQRATLHLQMALDLLAQALPEPRSRGVPTCH